MSKGNTMLLLGVKTPSAVAPTVALTGPTGSGVVLAAPTGAVVTLAPAGSPPSS